MAEKRPVAEITVTATEAKNRFGHVLSRVTQSGEAVIVERQGRPNAAIISIEEYRELRAFQERQRRQDALKRLEELRMQIAPAFADLSESEIERIADEIRHDVHQSLIEKGFVRIAE